MIRTLKSAALVAALCAVVASGAFAAAPTSTAPIGNSCTTLLPDSLFASIFPGYNGQAPKLASHGDDPQTWLTTKKETWKVGNTTTGGPISFGHTLPGTSVCYWYQHDGARVWFNVWYSQSVGLGRGVGNGVGWARSPTQAWKLYSSGAGSNGAGSRITEGKFLCPGGTPDAGFDMRECATQPVAGIGDRAAEGFGYIVFQEKDNTYEIGSVVDNPNTPTTYILPYATLEALAKKVAAEVAVSPVSLDKVTCVSGYPYQCGPKPYS
jgi:hypothetical protein